MYWKDKRFADYSIWLTRLLALIRAIGVTLIALLLFSPFVKTVKEDTKQPIAIIASDKSASIADVYDPSKFKEINEKINLLSQQLKEKYDVINLSFGSEIKTNDSDSINSKSTNLSKVIQYINDNYADQNLSAVILATDGIYNEGINPLYTNFNFGAPLYTIALGDTTQRKDLYIQNILHNKIAYLGDKFTVQVDISAFNCLSQNTKLTIEKISSNQVTKLGEENILINSTSFYTTKTFTIEANQVGVVRYRLKLTSLSGEYNISNNTKDIFIEVLDARQKILLLANAPHPDIAAIKSLIIANKNYEVNIQYISDEIKNLSDYNLAIIHNLPSENFDIQALATKLDQLSIPRIFIVGMQTSLPRFNKIQDVIQINGNSKNNEEIQAELNPGFSQFVTSDALKINFIAFPPLTTPFGEYKVIGNANVYLYQNIKKIKTNYPLIAFNEKNGIKTSIICGEGLWKWRLFDYLQHNNYDLVNEMLNKTVQLTSLKTDKRKFRVNTSKNIYKENEKVFFEAQLYNDSYEMINEPEIKLIISDEKNKEYNFNFSKTQNYYTLNADLFPNGTYNYKAVTIYNGKELVNNGKFIVDAIQLESYDLTARHNLLKGLSEKYNGEMIYLSEIERLADKLLLDKEVKPVIYLSSSTKSLIYLKWICFLLISLLMIEWFLRRYFGSY